MSANSRGGYHRSHGAAHGPSAHMRSALDNRISPEEQLFRKVRSILNKLTIERFEPLVQQLLCVGITSENVLKGIIILLFEKALDEPKFCPMYARVCSRLASEGPDFEPPNTDSTKAKTPTFLKLLLRKCQDEFENRSRAEELARDVGSFKDLEPGSADYRKAMAAHAELKAVRTKMLGNIMFIGELGKLDLLSEKVLHSCIVQLLADVESPPEEDVECLCQLLKTVGERLDHKKAEGRMNTYFERMAALRARGGLPPRIKFMIDDVVELRENRWVQRKLQQRSGPKSIMEVRLEAEEDQVKASASGRERQMGLQRIQRKREEMRLGRSRGMGMGGMDTGAVGFGGGDQGGLGLDMPITQIHDEQGFHSQPGGFSGLQRPQDLFGGLTVPSDAGSESSLTSAYGGDPRYNPGSESASRYHGANSEGRADFDEHSNSIHQDSHGHQRQSRRGPHGGPQDFRRLQKLPKAGQPISLRPSTKLIPGRRTTAPRLQNAETAPRSVPEDGNSVTASPMMGAGAAANLVGKTSKKGKSKLSKAELETQSAAIIDEFLGIVNLEEVRTCFKEMGVPKHAVPFTVQAVLISLDRKAEDRSNVCKLVVDFVKHDILKGNKLMKVLEGLLVEVEDLAIDIPMVKEYLGTMIAELMHENILSLSDFVGAIEKPNDSNSGGEPDTTRQDHVLLGHVLQSVVGKVGECRLKEIYTEAEINLKEYLPARIRNEEGILEFAAKYRVSCLFAMRTMKRQLILELQEKFSLSDVVKGGSSSGVQAIRQWLKEQPEDILMHKRFIFHAAVAVIEHIATSTTGKPEAASLKVDSSDWKLLKEQEKAMFEAAATLLRGLTKDKVELQCQIVYSLQVCCENLGHPKGLMLRASSHLYDFDVVEEAAFSTWREEVTDEFPGKGQALVAINEYLNWMRTDDDSDEESSDED